MSLESVDGGESEVAMNKRLSIGGLVPNNWYLSEEKLFGIEAAWRQGQGDTLPPITVTTIDQELVIIDGHTRAFVAWKNARSEIVAEVLALRDIDGPSWLYEHIHREGKKLGVRSVTDLAERILSASEYREKWVGYCTALAERGCGN